mmetsp:Transcript_8670/g.25294  ORF Transcript_8670/g.25294 Transcript_8670/m.25294 type:complete len:136 (-) Transcript_8670:1351-1758(-)
MRGATLSPSPQHQTCAYPDVRSRACTHAHAQVFKNPDILFEEVLQHIDTPLEMYVYNTETDTVRTVVILPTHNWGGEGSLGASVGHGYLHRLPLECLETPGRNQDINLGVPPAEKPAGEDKAQAAAPPPPPEDEG